MPDGSKGRAQAPATTGIASEVTNLSRSTAACRIAGFMVREDADAIYIADPHGTWMLPRDSYERLVEWSGGLSAPKHLAPTGQPVVAELREGATIYDITPRKVRKGGDPIERRKWRL